MTGTKQSCPVGGKDNVFMPVSLGEILCLSVSFSDLGLVFAVRPSDQFGGFRSIGELRGF